jgi:hypothetical protein
MQQFLLIFFGFLGVQQQRRSQLGEAVALGRLGADVLIQARGELLELMSAAVRITRWRRTSTNLPNLSSR